MTLDDIAAIPGTMLRATDVAPYLNADPQDIRNQARKDPSKLGFSVVVIGRSVKIPKEAFVKWMRGQA